MISTRDPVLVADVGGTHVRFGLAAGNSVQREGTLICSDYSGLSAAAREYLAGVGSSERPDRAVFAVASPVTSDRVSMTNLAWEFSVEELRRDLGLSVLRVVNDFTALALALPTLESDDLHRLKEGEDRPRAPMALLGPGTGLGVSALIPARETWWPLSSEGGHCGLAPDSRREWQVLEALRRRFGRVSAERVLSGPGLVNLYRALCELEGVEAIDPHPREIEARADSDTDSLEAEAIHLFSGWLGAFAGDLALTLGARGGVFLAGGVLPKMGPLFDREHFVRRFLDKGRFRGYLEAISIDLILHRTATLVGAARILDLEP